jgi:GTP diphosphokinase / guanosine-3',5'-bis(diphosphate) 3'-diphosphatase
MEKNNSRLSFLSIAENRDTFFQRIGRFFPVSDARYQLIDRAYNTAKDAFRDIPRESGERYFEHLRRVALIQIDYLFICDHHKIAAGLLHDIVEDIPSWTIDRVRQEFGSEVAFLVDWMTKTDKKSYHERFAWAPRNFFLLKFPDRWDNLLTLWDCPVEKIERKIAETKQYYIPCARRELILAHELEDALADLEKNRHRWGVKK